ncbi:MAG: recombinase family protein [Bacteroidales bacterium]
MVRTGTETNAREFQNMAYELEQKDVQLASIKENIDPTTRTGKMIAGILALFAEWEHETIREQMQENKMVRWRENRSFMGKLPFGYRWNKEKKEIEINEKEAEIYRRIVAMYVDQGMSYQMITQQLKNEGVKCKKVPFSENTLSSALKNPAYYGHYIVNQYVYEDSERGAGTRRTNKKKPVSEHIDFKIPPLISKSRWDEILHSREFKRHKNKRTELKTSDFILRDVLYCGECGARIRPRLGSKRKDGSQYKYYVCFWAVSSKRKLAITGKEKCCTSNYPANKLEGAIWGEILMRFSWNPKKVMSDLLNPEQHGERIKELELAVKQLENDLQIKQKARERLYRFLDYDDMDEEELRIRLHKNKEEILQLESNLNTARTKFEEAEQLQSREEDIASYFIENKEKLRQLAKDINKLDRKDKKLLVEGMLVDKKINVNYIPENKHEPAHWELDYKLQYNPEILNRFMDEGKILRLTKDYSYNSGRHKCCKGSAKQGAHSEL